MRVVIVGGGIAGLATAHWLLQTRPPDLDLDVRLVEPGEAGGRVRSLRSDGFVFEWGPHAILDDAEDTLATIEAVGLSGRLLRSRPEARRRLVLWRGRLRAAPSSPAGLLAPGLMPLKDRLRVLKEPFVSRETPERPDESVAAFARRRFGVGVVEPLVEPFVTGVFAGDVERLSVRAAFPALARLERDHGSVIRGAVRVAKARRREGRPRATLASFPGGLGELPRAIERALPAGTRLCSRARAVQRDGDGFAIDLEGEGPPTMRADVLVLATPARVTRELVEPLDADLAHNLDLIPHAGVAVCCLVYPARAVRANLDAFGFLCARREGRRILGCIFASSVFPDHAPEGFVSLRALLGGVHAPEWSTAPKGDIARVAHEELADILSIEGDPHRVEVFRHPGALPQYNLGHSARLRAIDERMRHLPRLFLTGAAYRGVSVNDCIRNGRSVASNVVRYLLTEGA